MTDSFLNFPDTFRQDVFEKILKAISRSESVTIIAPPGLGKTLFLQALPQKIKNAVYIDLNGEWDRQAFAESVIVLDHAETLCKPENEAHLRFFRSFRDASRHRLSFIFAINPNIANNFDLFGPIKSTVLENILYLEPLNPADASICLAKSEELYQGKLTPAQRQKVLTLSGGIPRFIKRLCKLFLDNIDPKTDPKLQNDLQEINKFLVNNPQLKWKIPLLVPSVTNNDQVGEIEFRENLSKQEFLLAKLLIENKGNMVTREAMIEAVWQSKMYDVNDHALDQMLHRLRQKLATATPKCELVVFRGRGVKLTY